MPDFTIIDALPSSDELLARRAEITERVAPYRALYGGNGYMGERMFKLDEARVAIAVRARLTVEGKKVTEPMVDAETRADAEYIAALTKDVRDRAEWVELEEKLNEIDWRLRMRQSDAMLLAAEARLTPGAA
jgi:hypothetical protein